MLIRRLVLVAFLLVPQIAFSAPGSAVFNSFKDRSLALKELAQISRRFGVEARIEEALVGGTTYHRVLGPVMDRASVQELVRQARTNGFADAWILSSMKQPIVRTEMRQPDPIREVLRRSIPAEVPKVPEVVQKATVEPLVDQSSNMIARVVNASDLSSSNSTVMRIARVEDADIKIDGRVDEAIWDEIPAFDRMRVMNPDTLVKTKYPTKTRIFSDSKGLYVSAVMVQPESSLVERLTPRDVSVNADTFYAMIDSSGEGLYGYTFGLSLGGSKADGKIAPERVMSFEWDGP